MVSPHELKKSSFSKTLKGYSPAEVDGFIDYLLAKYNEAYNEYAELERRYSAALIQLNDVQTEETIVTAKILDAQKMAEEIVGEAKAKANGIRGSVAESCDKILDVYRTKVAAERDKLIQCEKAVAEFKDSLYNAYKNHIALIDNIMPDEEPTPYLTDDELEDKAVEIANKMIKSGTFEGSLANDEVGASSDASDDKLDA